MTSQLDVAKGREVVARWCNLAEQRLEYLTELFETGRWRRFHSERAFLENIREAKGAVDAWRELLSREASVDNRPINLAWLGRPRTAMPESPFRRESIRPQPIMEVLPVLPSENSILADDIAVEANETARGDMLVADTLVEEVMALVPDLATIAERYPLLRNTL